jgi:hypothetical protein
MTMAHPKGSSAPGPSITGNLHALAKLLGDMLEAVTEAEALAARGDINAAIGRMDGLEAGLNDATDICRGTFALHRTR